MSDNQSEQFNEQNKAIVKSDSSTKSKIKEKTEKSKISNQSKIIITSVIVLLCAIIGLLVFIILKNDQEYTIGDGATPLGNLIVDSSNLSDIKQAITTQIEKGMFATYMNTTWNFPDSNSPSTDAVMGNSPSNNYPFWFSLVIGDDEVYRSSVLLVGTQMNEIILNTDLPVGTYNALMDVNMIDENGDPVESNMRFGITINILN